LQRAKKLAATLAIDLNEQQAAFIRRSLAQTIESMRSLFLDLHRENMRWSSPETKAALIKDEAEIAALQRMVDALAELQRSQGWREAPDAAENRPA
jgi:hypothetical protein